VKFSLFIWVSVEMNGQRRKQKIKELHPPHESKNMRQQNVPKAIFT
jgi:hypothetical protein